MRLEKLGSLALEKGDYQEAVNIFRRALDDDESVEGWMGLARAFLGLDETPAARWAAHKGLAYSPGHQDILKLTRHIEERMKTPRPVNSGRPDVRFRVGKSGFEKREGGAWRPFFVKGINLGLAVPGTYPGEYPIGKTQYLRWFGQMAHAGFNTVRVYAIQSPSFYEALAEANDGKNALYLIQGVWIEPPDDGDFSSEAFMGYARRQITEAVDALFGRITLPERPGQPHGVYTRDVSPQVAGIIFGREWEGCPIGKYNRLRSAEESVFNGVFLSGARLSPFERWICRMLDELLVYEERNYGVTHPVSTVCWPTLDPLAHPSESLYEDGLRWQGLSVKASECNENEDAETLDTAKITARKGSGFFATYHAYPYYPDFMNNDYLDREKPYSAYLRQLKAHHKTQPILIAEYGVPSSREVSHWQRQGWHHGGHDEDAQGRINGEMLQAIAEAGLAGGALFSWFDEWFKRNWLFMNYERPAGRNALWFNLQDAEQCYGLVGAYPGYPGKTVDLTGNASQWRDATALYRKDDSPAHRFHDGGDEARRLRSLAVQHDEGFLYLALTLGGPVDFNRGHYAIGIDTCDPATGEFRLPFRLHAQSPVGLKFLVHLSGVHTSRILVCASYDKYLNDPYQDLRPRASREGAWVSMHHKTNDRRISKNRDRVYPARVFPISALRHGSLVAGHPHYDSLADFHVTGNLIELRLAWGLLMVTDPSSRAVYWKQGEQWTRQTEGLRFVAYSFKPSGRGWTAEPTGRADNATDRLPGVMEPRMIRPYAWRTWNVPLFHFYEKKSLAVYRRYLKEIAP